MKHYQTLRPFCVYFPSPHQLLVCHHVGLVQADPDLVVMGPDRLDRVLELVRDVKLVGVEQQDDPVGPLREPLENLGKVVTSLYRLFLPGQNT